MVNGHGPYRFLIDLGSNVINFKQSVVESAGMHVIVDREKGDIVCADKLQIANSVFLDVYGAAYEDLDVDGVLGFNLLGKGNFLMDYPQMQFAFISDLDMPVDSTFVSYEVLGRMPYLKSIIGGKPFLVNFDTGASGWLYFPSAMRDSVNIRTAIKNGAKVWNNQTGTTQSTTAQISDDIHFGNYIISAPVVVFLPDIEDIFVGSSLLSDFKLTFYTSRKLVKMERQTSNFIIQIPNHTN